MSRDDPRRVPRLFRWMLGFYPRDFRQAYGEEMTSLFLTRLERARERGAAAVARLWARTLADLTRTALAERQGVRDRTDEEGRMTTWLEELTHAARRLARTPLFTLGAAAIVAFGIGVNAAAFSVVDAFLFRPPPFDDPERVVRIFQDSDDGDPSSSSFPAYRDMTGFDDTFEAVAAISPEGATWERDEGNEPLAVAFVSASYLDVLGLRPALGRWFEPAHDQVGSGLYAVVSHRTWRSRMGADPAVVGSTLRLNGQIVTVIGVGPEGFHGIYGPAVTDLWLSISSTPVGGPWRVANLDRRQDHWYDVVGRLAEGVTVERAQAAMDGLAARLAADFPDLNRGRDITVFASADVRIHPEVDGSLYPAAGLLLGVVGLILLLACANLANLLLVRGMARGPEVAVRRALGASGGRVASLFLMEGLLLSALGGAAGLLLANALLGLFLRLPVPVPGGGATLELGIDARVATFALLLVLVTGVLFGLAPALRSARSDVVDALREESRSASAGRQSSAFRNALVAVQVAVSIVLLVGTGVVLRSLASVGAVDPGVDVERLAYVGVALPTGVQPGPETVVTFESVADRIAALPGVTAVARSTRLPVQNSGGTTTRFVEGYVAPSGTGNVELDYNLVDEGYFETVGIPVVAGRAFTPDDGPGSGLVMLVNETAARRFWSGGSAVGGRVRAESAESPWAGVVGVVGDSKVRTLDEAETPYIYFPLSRAAVGRLFLLARTEGDAVALTSALRAAVREVDPSLDVFRAGSLESHVATSLDPLRTASLAMGAFSLLAILLATLGIYAVVSFVVARRTAELGIRIALGAARRRIVGMVVRDVLVTVGVGMAVGLAVAALILPRVAGALMGGGGLDPVAFAGAAALFLAVAAFAAWLPARRAAQADPVDALRAG